MLVAWIEIHFAKLILAEIRDWAFNYLPLPLYDFLVMQGCNSANLTF